MRKLRLDTLVVESFPTADATPARGTVDGHAAIDTQNHPDCGPYTTTTYDVNICEPTEYLDCTFGCPSYDTACRHVCGDVATP